MPFKDPKKRKKYVDKYNREHPITKEKRHEYYLNRKLKQYKGIFNMYALEMI